MSATQAAMSRQKSGNKSTSKESEATINVAEGLARAIGQGISFGFADEAEAYIRSKFSDRDYKEIRNEIRSKINKFRDEETGLAYGAEIAGSIATALTPAGLAGAATRAAPTIAKGIQSLAGGPFRRAMLGGATYGAGTAEEVSDIPLSSATGAAVGGIAQKVTPQVTGAAKSLIRKGASLSPGEKYGGLLGAVEKGLESTQITAGLVGGKGGLTQESVAPVMYGEVMSALGKKMPVGLSAREAFEFTKTEFKKQYDDALEGVSLPVDKTLKDSINNVLSKHSAGFDELAASDMKKLNSLIDSKILGSATKGKLDAGKFKSIQSEIKRQTRRLLSKDETSVAEDNLVDALTAIDDVLMGRLAATNKPKAEQIKKVNRAYSMYKPLERASFKAGTEAKGAFTARQVDTEIRRQAKSSPSAYISGKAPMQKTVEEFADVQPTIRAGLPALGVGGAGAAGVTAAGAGTVGLSTAGSAALPLMAPLGIAAVGSTRTGRGLITPRVAGRAMPGVIDVPSMAVRSPATAGLLSQEPGPQRYTRAAGEAVRGVPDYVMGLLR